MAEETVQPLEGEPTEAPRGIRAFLATPGGKLVAAGGALGLLAVIGGVVAAIIVFSGLKGGSEKNVLPITPASNSATSTPSGDSEETTVVPPAVPDSEVFTFRDVFKPLLVKASEVTSSGTTPGSSEASATAGDNNTLYLQDVTVEDGKDKAVLTFNGTQFTLGEGATIEGTPWKVLTISAATDSVVMLYGDSQITLAVGQGTSSSK